MQFLNLLPGKDKTSFFGDRSVDRGFFIFFTCIFLKFLLFDVIWCAGTTFASFSYVGSYFNTALVTVLLLLPWIAWRSSHLMLGIFLALDLFLISNLMYFRTYGVTIPLDSYRLLGNLKDFKSSVYDSLRPVDIFFPIISLVAWWVWKKRKCDFAQPGIFIRWGRYLFLCCLLFLISGTFIVAQGGYRHAYESILKMNRRPTIRVPLYTVFGTLYYEWLDDHADYTPDIEQQITAWLSSCPLRDKYSVSDPRASCIVILAESFESWVLERTFEDKEITPCLNALLKEENTLYAPYVLTQVKGGRSIDAQLLIYTGLLPIESGAYSLKYPPIRACYSRGLVHAFKEKYKSAKAYSMLVDKKIVWNQGAVQSAFGFDGIIDRNYFTLEPGASSRKGLGDLSFMQQCAGKLQADELWPQEGHTFLMCVTYSGHNPFIIPEADKRIHFSDTIPVRMRDFMTVANYTDYAIGTFVKAIRSNPKFANTMIVITGDHEGLADSRKELCASPAGHGFISEEQFTPFIVINSPVSLRYEEVMGQVDIYPTLLEKLGLERYYWKGLGQSILDPDKRAYAVSPLGQFVGNTREVPAAELKRSARCWSISDYIIKYDYFGRDKE